MSGFSRTGRKSLLGRVLFINLVFAFASVVSLTAVFLASYHAEFERQQMLRAQTMAHFVARQIEVAALVGDRASISKIAQSALSAEDVLLVRVSYRGQAPPIELRRQGPAASRLDSSGLLGQSWLEATEEIRPMRSGLLDWDDSASRPPEIIGRVLLRVSLHEQEVLFRRLVRRSLLVVGALLLVVITLQFLGIQKLLQPLESLIAFTRRVGDGNFEERAPVADIEEVADVAIAFNQMLDCLRRSTVSRDYVDNIIRSMAECLIVVGNDGMIQIVNEATLSLLRYTEPELLNVPVSRIVGEGAPTLLEPLRSVEQTWFTSDGQALIVFFSSAALHGPDGEHQGFVWLAQDITARKRIREQLVAAQERYTLAVAGANDGIWDWNTQTGEVYFSPRWKAMLGYEENELADTFETWMELLHPEDRDRVRDEIAAHQRGDSETLESEHRMRHRNGRFRWMLTRGLAVRNAQGSATRMAGSQTDITQNKVSDPLTGLPNRVLFTERLSRAFDHRRRDPSLRFAVLFLDLDRFKMINDSLGHLAGDQLLLGIASRFRDRVAAEIENDDFLVARLSGDEFAVLLEGLREDTAAQVAGRIGERLIRDLSKPFHIADREVFTSVSIGIAPDNGEYTTPAEILRDADTAMYRAKARGKSRFEVFDAEMRAQAITRLELDTDMRNAIELNQFVVFYQPKFSMPDQRLEGFEALVRWQHPTRGLIPPADFIPLAEETGLILPLGAFVLRETCRQTREWVKNYPDCALRVSVNISPRQFVEPGFATLVADILAETGLDPRVLYLEVTEGVLIGDTELAIERLNDLKKLGVGLKIDDFGTGYSSLNYLHRYPFDTVKIDRSFVANLESEDGAAIVRAIITLAQDLGMEVIAEGVETPEQLNRLYSFGCSHGQGFLFSKAIPAGKAATLIASYNTPGSYHAPAPDIAPSTGDLTALGDSLNQAAQQVALLPN